MSDADVSPISHPAIYEIANEPSVAAVLRWANRMIEPFRDLPSNWDSYGGLPVNGEAADFAARLLAVLVVDGTPPPQACPTSDGGLSFEWHWPTLDFVISIAPPEDVSTAYFRSGADHWEIDDFHDPRFWEAVSALRAG